MDIVRISRSDLVGHDGDWSHSNDEELVAHLGLCGFADKDARALLSTYVDVDLDAIHELSDGEFADLCVMWRVANKNCWTIASDDEKIRAEIERRQSMSDDEDVPRCSDCGGPGPFVPLKTGGRVCRDCWMGEEWDS